MTEGANAPPITRRIPVGPELVAGGAHFRVWAPERRRVEVVFEDSRTHSLKPESDGYFEVFVPDIHKGDRYNYALDGEGPFPDPASRFQPLGPHGPSEIVDPQFDWNDASWPGLRIENQVLYEMHIGTFTREGTWGSAADELARLAEIGITCLEVMPVAEFPGQFGWGYDGTFWFAPYHVYGSPDDFRRFVDTAHALSLGVILDVVYNHLGPDGNYLGQFSPYYFSKKKTEWGDAINFDGERARDIREFVLANIRYWIEEFHLDGFRLDATQQIFDRSSEHIVAAIARVAREAARSKNVVVIAENEPNETFYVRPRSEGGLGLDALWNDDFHHSAYVALTGHNEAYYSGHFGKPQEFISAVKYGCLYQGQLYAWQKKRRGIPALDLPPSTSVLFLENHDQVSNSARGDRLHTICDRGLYRAMTALLLLAPGTPLLFQGQEFGASSPFVYFADHHQGLAPLVHNGRIEFLSQFPSIAVPEVQKDIPNPADPQTFERCKLIRTNSTQERQMLAFHQDLLTLRRNDPAFAAQRLGGADGAVLSDCVFVLRFLMGNLADRLLIVNFGTELELASIPEPLLAPPKGTRWETIWSSESPSYGGMGAPSIENSDGWRFPGRSAVVLGPYYA